MRHRGQSGTSSSHCSALLDGALRGMDSFMQELQDEMEGDEVGSECDGGSSSSSSYGLGGEGDSDRDEEDSNASFRLGEAAGSDSEGDGEEEWDP